jgi:hypothetical protein
MADLDWETADSESLGRTGDFELVGIPFAFQIDPQLVQQYPLLQSNLEAAGKILSKIVGGQGRIEVEVLLSQDTTYNTAQAGPDWVCDLAKDASGAQFQLAIPAPLYEAQTGSTSLLTGRTSRRS